MDFKLGGVNRVIQRETRNCELNNTKDVFGKSMGKKVFYKLI